MKIKCAGCGKEFDTDLMEPYVSSAIKIGEKQVRIDLFACSFCGVLMTKRHGPVKIDFGPMFATKDFVRTRLLAAPMSVGTREETR